VGKRFSREEIIDGLRAQLADGRSLLAVGAGNGLVARCAEEAGADLLVVYNSGYYRLNGLPSLVGNLPIGDANAVTIELGLRNVIPAVRQVPVIGGIYASDPTRDKEDVLDSVARAGFSGIINFPTVGRVDGRYREELEAAGLGFNNDVEMVALARRRGTFTMAYVFNAMEAEQMADVGLDVLVGHVGLTAGGDVGSSRAIELDSAVELLRTIYDGARRVRNDLIFLSHGGPIVTPEHASHVNLHTGSVGFVAASSVERVPVEAAVKAACRDFKHISISRSR
jgi:predicted TIM-barrel enzyme